MNDTDDFAALTADATDPADDPALAEAAREKRERQPAVLALMLGLLSIPLGLVLVGGLFAVVGLIVGLRQTLHGGPSRGTAIGGVAASVLGLATTTVSVLAIMMALAAGRLGPQAAAETAAWTEGHPEIAWRFEALDGTVLEPSAFRGRVVVLDLWATWCKPCTQMIPVMSQVASANPDDIVVVGLCVGREPEDDVRRFVERERITYPVAIVDPADLPAPLSGVQALPTIVVLDRQGRIAAASAGMHDLPEMRMLIEAADR